MKKLKNEKFDHHKEYHEIAKMLVELEKLDKQIIIDIKNLLDDIFNELYTK